MSRIARASAIVLLLLAGACSDGKSAKPSHPVVLIGLDGLEWSVAKPLLQRGEMPNLRRLIESGTSGYLYTFKPTYSPSVWTTIATGKTREQHGVLQFLREDEKPYASSNRRGKALWNIASDYGLKTLCVGWWITWPAEEIEGWMVAPYSAAGQNADMWKGNLRKGGDLADQTWPRSLIDEVYPIAERLTDPAGQWPDFDRNFFGGVELEKLREPERKLVAHTRWSSSADGTFAGIAESLLSRPEVKPDLTMLYLGGTDVSAHRFWRYRDSGGYEYEIPPDSIEELRDVIDRFYRWSDAAIGRVLARLPADANVIVCSDHGFHASLKTMQEIELTQSGQGPIDPLAAYSGHHQDAPPGIIVCAGPDFRAGEGAAAVLDSASRAPILDAGWVYDVAPTVLYLLGIPGGVTMAAPYGGPLLKAVVRPETRAARPAETAVDHDLGFRPPSDDSPSASAAADRAFTDQLGQLGYLTNTLDEAHQDVGPASRPKGNSVDKK